MDYTEIQAVALELINDHGRTVSFKAPGTPTNLTQPWRNGAADTTVATGVAVFVPHTGPGLGAEFIPADLLSRVKEYCLVGYNGTDLSTAKIINDVVDCRVEWCYTLKPGSVVLLYAFGISR